MTKNRSASLERTTAETTVRVHLALDGRGDSVINTGVGFYDHLLDHMAVHGLLNLEVQARGDLHIDVHHTVEDVAILLGAALDEALGDRRGIRRMGHAVVPMDEALASVTVDLSGRPYAVIQAAWHGAQIGQLPTTLVAHVLETMAVHARMNLHARVHYGRDDHHQAEALFKALGRALADAVALDPRRGDRVPSTKGVIT